VRPGKHPIEWLAVRPTSSEILARPARFVTLFLIDWTVIAVAALLWSVYPRWWIAPAIALVVGARQHGLAVLMHETVHQRALTRIMGWICAWSLLISWASFRCNHLAHHRWVHTENDPDLQFKLQARPEDWRFPMSTARLVALFSKDLAGYGVVSNLRRLRRYRGASDVHSPDLNASPDPVAWRITFTVTFVVLWVAVIGWRGFLAAWVLPLFTTLPWMLRVRSVAEHFNLPTGLAEPTRVVRASWFEREFLGFGPHMIGYHAPHHLFPGVCCHNLKALDYRLQNNEGYNAGFKSADGYFLGRDSVFNQLRYAP
jgi:fatty acid desaturase